MRFKGTLVLFFVSLIAGSAYLFYVLPQGREQKLIEAVSRRFFRIDSEKVEFMRIQNPRGMFDLVREEGRWKIKSPRALPADGKTIEKISGVIRGEKIVKMITDDPGKMADYGLQHPPFILFLGYEGKIDELALGDVNPAGTGIYAFARGINAIFLMDREIAKALDVGLYDLRSKSPFNFDPEAVTRIRLRRDKDEIELVKNQDGWTLARPSRGRASGEAVIKYLSDILNQRAEEIYDDRTPKASDYRRTVRITFFARGGNDPCAIDVHYWGTGIGEGVVAYQKGMAYSGRLAREFWAVADRDASYFRYKNLFQFDEQRIGRIRVSQGTGKYSLVRKGDAWQMDGRRVDGKDAMNFVWFLKGWSAVKLLGPSAAFRKEAPKIEIVLEDASGKNMGSVVVFGKTGEGPAGYTSAGLPVDLYYAVSDNLKEPCIVSSGDFKSIPRREDLIR